MIYVVYIFHILHFDFFYCGSYVTEILQVYKKWILRLLFLFYFYLTHKNELFIEKDKYGIYTNFNLAIATTARVMGFQNSEEIGL